MDKVRYKLQNILIDNSPWPEEYRPMLYQGDAFGCEEEVAAHTLRTGQSVSFFTYFNACSVEKWYRLTQIENLSLTLTCQGEFCLQLCGHYPDGSAVLPETFEAVTYHLHEKTTIHIPVPDILRSTVIGFRIMALSEHFRLYEGSWTTMIDNRYIKDIRIAITAVTFQRESFITHTMSLLQRALFDADKPAAQHFRLRVIDNGRTLDPEKWNSDFIELLPHDNNGSAGGFAFGLQKSLDDDRFDPTHILFMEDDTEIWPETLLRTHALLSLLKPDYDKHLVCGAMLCAEHRNLQQETLCFVREDGTCGQWGAGYDMNTAEGIVQNEQASPLPPYAFAPWRYCCLPVGQLDTEHFPASLFMRGADMAYSLSTKAQFLTLNGICFWHKDRSIRFDAFRDFYLWYRNSLIVQSTYGLCQNVDFIRRIDALFWQELSCLAYDNAECLLDAAEDFCHAPSSLQDSQLLEERRQKQEPMYPLTAFYPDIPMDDNALSRKSLPPLTPKQQRLYDRTCNGQTKPRLVHQDTLAVIAYNRTDDLPQQYMAEKILAVNPFNHTAHLRTRSKSRFRSLVLRHRRVFLSLLEGFALQTSHKGLE